MRTHCKRGHPLTPDNTYVNRTGRRSFRHCRTCHRERKVRRRADPVLKEQELQRRRERRARNRAAFMKECRLCGSTEHLELDHVDPAGKLDHRIWDWGREKREAELAKCRVLCRACHHERHRLA